MDRKGGLSRAAKKRKLKKQKTREDDGLDDDDEEVQEIAAAVPSITCAIDSCVDKVPSVVVPLEEALNSTDFDVSIRAHCILRHFLSPLSCDEFYQTIWEQRAHVFSREDDEVYAPIYTPDKMQALFTGHVLRYPTDYSLRKTDATSSVELDVSKAQCIDEGEYLLKPKVIWRHVQEGYCLRIHHPQKFDDDIWQTLSLLEHEFGDIMESRITVMGAGCSGWGLEIAEGHLLLLQVEGQGHYRIYDKPPSPLTTTNDPDESPAPPIIDPSSIGSPILNTIVSVGGLVYVPKGFVFECNACRGSGRCAYISIITGTDYASRGLLDLTLPQALEAASMRNKSLQSLLPRSLLQFMGVARSENDDDIRRKRFFAHARDMLEAVTSSAIDMMDAAADQLAKRFISGRLPVPLTDEEEANSGQGCAADTSVFPYTKLRMLRPGIARAIVENGVVVLYHCMDNARELHASPLNPLEFDLDDGPAIEEFLDAYPEGVVVSDVHHVSEELEDKLEIARALFKEGFLVIVDDASKKDVSDNSDNGSEAADSNPF